MTSAVLLGHAVLAASLLVARALPAAIRVRFATGIALLGAALGGLQVALWESGERWRSATLDLDGAPIAGAASLAAWMIVATLRPPDDRWWAGAFAGVAATGLGMFASNDWLVPALLFWATSSVALIALILRARGGMAALAAIGVSDALLIAAAIQVAFERGEWALPSGSSGGWFWVLAAASLLRSGTIPMAANEGLAPGPARVAMPLLAGGGVSIAAGFGERSEPWLAAALVALSVLWALFAAIRRAPSITLPCAALAAVGLATIYAGANAAGAAGIAVALGAGGLLIARAGAGSALLVALVPLTPGFVAVAASAEVSFRGATEAPDGAASAPWAALAALLPVALAASVAVGGRILRSRGVDQNRSTSAAVALLAGAAVAAGIWGVGARGAGGDPAVLSVAVGAGSVAGIAAATRKKPLSVHGPEALAIPSQSTHEGRGARSVGVMLTAIVVADLSAMVLVTLEGLRTGFL